MLPIRRGFQQCSLLAHSVVVPGGRVAVEGSVELHDVAEIAVGLRWIRPVEFHGALPRGSGLRSRKKVLYIGQKTKNSRLGKVLVVFFPK